MIMNKMLKKISFVLLILLCFPVMMFADCNLEDNIKVGATPNGYADFTAANGKTTYAGTYELHDKKNCGNDANGNPIFSDGAFFCITPQLHSQSVMNYTMSADSAAIANCKNSKDFATSSQCGMVAILQSAYVGAGNDTNYAQLNAAITFALRLWAATDRKTETGVDGKNDSFDDSAYGGAFQGMADYIWDTVNSGGQISNSELQRYFKETNDPTFQLAVSLFSQAAQGVEITRVDDFIGNTDDREASFGEDGTATLEWNINRSFNSLNDLKIDGVASDQVTFTKGKCSDGSGDCLRVEISDAARKQLCEGKPDGTKVNISANVTSTSAVDKMRIYSPSSQGNNQTYVGFDSHGREVPLNFSIDCETIDDSEDPCTEKEGKYYGPEGQPLNSKDEYDDLCDPGKCEEKNNKFYGKNGQNVGSKEAMLAECSCNKTDDNKFYGPSGEPLSEDKWYELCDPGFCEEKNGQYYGTNGRVSSKAEMDAQCSCFKDDDTILGPNGTPISEKEWEELCAPGVCQEKNGVYYGKNGQVVNSKAQMDAECSCYKDEANGKYYGLNGGEVSEKEWDVQCGPGYCTEKNGKYYNKRGQEVSKEEMEKDCDCQVVVDENNVLHYYGKGGEEVGSVDEYKEQCEPDENPDNCPMKKKDDLPYATCVSGDTEGELADPPMCTILKNSVKGAYKIDEYSNEYCDVYCRESYEFKFMDKETAQSGRYFRHDVSAKYVTVSNLSVVVTATQQCTSLINYDDWKNAYKAANGRVRDAWNKLKMWEARWEVSSGQTGLPTETIDCGGGCSNCCYRDSHDNACGDWAYLWYDNTFGYTFPVGTVTQLNANLTETGRAAECASSECAVRDSNGVCISWECRRTHRQATTAQQEGFKKTDVQEGHNAAINEYTNALNVRQNLIQSLFDCNFYDDDEVNRYFASSDPHNYEVSYWQKNIHTTREVKSNTYHSILRDYAPNSEVENLSYDDQSRLREEGSASNVSFSKDVQPAIGTDAILLKEKKGYKTGAESNDPNDNTVCGGCLDPIDNSLSPQPKDDEEYGVMDGNEFTFWVCKDHTSNGKCEDKSEIISLMPKNYVANMEVQREIGYYQSATFSTEIFTGKVVSGGGGLQLPDKSWPLAIGTLTGDYNINLKFTKFGDAKRKQGTLKLEFDTDVVCGYAVVNEMTKYDCDDGYHECYGCDDPNNPDCYPGGGPNGDNKLDLGFYFRSIDLTDIFPNSIYSPNKTLLNPNRPIGSNWNTPNAIQVIQKIQDLGNGYIGSSTSPEYSITLTPSMRKAVAKNNKDIYKLDYLTTSTLSCNSSTAICQSTWLQKDLINILNDYNHGEYFVQNDNSRNNLYVVGRN